MIDTVCAPVIDRLKTRLFVETGTYEATSTRFVRDHCSVGRVISIDLDHARVLNARVLFRDDPGVSILQGNSPDVLKALIDAEEIREALRPVFFIDAHWNAYWPILDELKQVNRLGSFVAIVDDVLVPGHPEFGFDSYQGQPLCWDFIKGEIPGPVRLFYPTRPNPGGQGWCLVSCGRSEIGEAVAGLPIVEVTP